MFLYNEIFILLKHTVQVFKEIPSAFFNYIGEADREAKVFLSTREKEKIFFVRKISNVFRLRRETIFHRRCWSSGHGWILRLISCSAMQGLSSWVFQGLIRWLIVIATLDCFGFCKSLILRVFCPSILGFRALVVFVDLH